MWILILAGSLIIACTLLVFQTHKVIELTKKIYELEITAAGKSTGYESSDSIWKRGYDCAIKEMSYSWNKKSKLLIEAMFKTSRGISIYFMHDVDSLLERARECNNYVDSIPYIGQLAYMMGSLYYSIESHDKSELSLLDMYIEYWDKCNEVLTYLEHRFLFLQEPV